MPLDAANAVNATNRGGESDGENKDEDSSAAIIVKQSKAESVESNADQNVDDVPPAAPSETKTNNDNNASKKTTESVKPMSKNQLKRKRRWEHLMRNKEQRKQQDRETKRAKAKAQGRDLKEERRLLEERTIAGDGKKRRQEEWEKNKLPLIKESFQLCIDCNFEESMKAKEINSLASQIRYAYASNKRSPHPCLLSVSSLGGTTLQHLENVAGFDEWSNRAFVCTNKSLEEHFKSNLDKVVYLTSDSEHTLHELENDKIYVIGGIVDRNRLKQAALTRAQELGVATAKLPLDDHIQTKATRVLTCNHVVDILLKYREHGKDWKMALAEVLPQRKDVTVLS